MELGPDKFKVFLYLADERGDCTYSTEHRFLERPDVATIRCLFDEAKQHYGVVYGQDAIPEDFAVRVAYLDDGCEG